MGDQGLAHGDSGMRLVSRRVSGGWRPGLLIDGVVVDVAAAAARLSEAAPRALTSGRAVLEVGADGRAALAGAARDIAAAGDGDPVGAVRLGPPIPDPDKIICIGLNYGEHADELGLDSPAWPVLFPKFRNALIGPTDDIGLPTMSREIDFEGELAVVIGRRCKDVDATAARSYVAGYMAFNDVTARDLQWRTSQWLSGKALDTFAPCGPAIVFAEDVADPQNLDLVTRLNGEVVQQANTREMIFSIDDLIEHVSALLTLEPGDILATGTPAGVGFRRDPQVFLTAGDCIEVEIAGIGSLANPVVGREGSYVPEALASTGGGPDDSAGAGGRRR